MHRREGPRSHPGMVSHGWGINTLRLVWDTRRGWTLHQGCSRGHSRRCLCTLSWGAVYGSPRSACFISGKGTGLTLGPESILSAGANHGWRLGCAARADDSSGSDVQRQRVAGKAVWCSGEKCRCAVARDGDSDECEGGGGGVGVAAF